MSSNFHHNIPFRSSKTSIVLLAAGSSSRLGEPKQLLQFGPQTLIEKMIEQALFSKCQSVVVVLGANRQLILPKISHYPIQMVVNKQWDKGMGSSLKVGLNAVLKTKKDSDGILTMVCDQPFLKAEHLQKILEQQRQTNASIVASTYHKQLGVPAFFSKALFAEIQQLKEKEGAKKLILRHQQSVETVSFPQGIFDVDTPEDYQKLSGIFSIKTV